MHRVHIRPRKDCSLRSPTVHLYISSSLQMCLYVISRVLVPRPPHPPSAIRHHSLQNIAFAFRLINLKSLGTPPYHHMASNQQQQQHVRVGVGVLVKNPSTNKVYCGIRKGSHGAGSLALPGGHLEMYETWSDCAKREIQEEMDITIQNVQFGHVTNDMMSSENKHYVTIFMKATCTEEPRNMEPEKCQGWKAYSWKELKDIYLHDASKLFGPLAKLVEEEPQSVQDFLSS